VISITESESWSRCLVGGSTRNTNVQLDYVITKRTLVCR